MENVKNHAYPNGKLNGVSLASLSFLIHFESHITYGSKINHMEFYSAGTIILCVCCGGWQWNVTHRATTITPHTIRATVSVRAGWLGFVCVSNKLIVLHNGWRLAPKWWRRMMPSVSHAYVHMHKHTHGQTSGVCLRRWVFPRVIVSIIIIMMMMIKRADTMNVNPQNRQSVRKVCRNKKKITEEWIHPANKRWWNEMDGEGDLGSLD